MDPNHGGQPPPGQYGAPPPGQYPPGQYGAPPPGQYGAPPPGQYGAPPPGQYGAPPPGQYPPGQYGAPPPGQYPQYGQPAAGYNQQGGVTMYPGAPGAPPAPPGAPPPGQPGGQQNWMPKPEAFAGCPPGLEYLTQIDQLIVHQQIDLMEMMTGWEQANKYRVMNSVGQPVYFAAEESDACMRQCCGPSRGFKIHIMDNTNREVLMVEREFKCCSGCCWFACTDGCAHEVVIKDKSPEENILGKIRQECSAFKPHYSIRDAADNVVAVVRGPCCQCTGPCCSDIEFNIMNQDESTEIGKIAKKSGFEAGMMDAMTDSADKFSVSFPMDMDVRMKATFIGALFLIDFVHFEQAANNQNNRH